MATLGICAYCEKVAERTCKLCGKAICQAHTHDATELCTVCARGSAIEGGEVNV